MTVTIEAIYEKGVLKPVSPLNISEHKKVTLMIKDEPETPTDILSPASLVNNGLSPEDIADMEKLLLDRSHLGNSYRTKTLLEKVMTMRKEYDFSKAQKNPYASRLKRQVTLRMDEGTISYFKALAQENGVPYQTLINLYLRDCASSHKKLALHWKTA